MSAPTIATHPGRKPTSLESYRTRTRPQALQEALEDTRTSLMKALDQIDAEFNRPLVHSVPAEPRIDTDPVFWRREHHDFDNYMRSATCRCCKGTAEVWVYIDFPPDPCPACQEAFLLGPKGDDVSIF